MSVPTRSYRILLRYVLILQLILFWVVSAFQLVLLAKTLPDDQDGMEAELASYALHALANTGQAPLSLDDSFVSIEDRMTSFDGLAARQTLQYVSEGIRELKAEMSGNRILPCGCVELDSTSSSEDGSMGDVQHIWRYQDGIIGDLSFDTNHHHPDEDERNYPGETTPLVV